MKTRLTAVLLLAGAVIAGCGSGGPNNASSKHSAGPRPASSSGPVTTGAPEPAANSSDDAAIATTIRAYLTGLSSGDDASACSQVTPAAAAALAQAVPQSGGSCKAAVAFVFLNLTRTARTLLQHAQPTDIHVSGNSASAQLVGGTRTIKLQKVNGTWLISGGFTP